MNKIDLDVLKSLYINKYSNQIDLSKWVFSRRVRRN